MGSVVVAAIPAMALAIVAVLGAAAVAATKPYLHSHGMQPSSEPSSPAAAPVPAGPVAEATEPRQSPSPATSPAAAGASAAHANPLQDHLHHDGGSSGPQPDAATKPLLLPVTLATAGPTQRRDVVHSPRPMDPSTPRLSPSSKAVHHLLIPVRHSPGSRLAPPGAAAAALSPGRAVRQCTSVDGAARPQRPHPQQANRAMQGLRESLDYHQPRPWDEVGAVPLSPLKPIPQLAMVMDERPSVRSSAVKARPGLPKSSHAFRCGHTWQRRGNRRRWARSPPHADSTCGRNDDVRSLRRFIDVTVSAVKHHWLPSWATGAAAGGSDDAPDLGSSESQVHLQPWPRRRARSASAGGAAGTRPGSWAAKGKRRPAHLRTILKDINGCACVGEVVGIMGPSGSGKVRGQLVCCACFALCCARVACVMKCLLRRRRFLLALPSQSTLLNVLSGQVCSGGAWHVEGTVRLGKRSLTSHDLVTRCAAVPQHDLLLRFLTVEEALRCGLCWRCRRPAHPYLVFAIHCGTQQVRSAQAVTICSGAAHAGVVQVLCRAAAGARLHRRRRRPARARDAARAQHVAPALAHAVPRLCHAAQRRREAEVRRSPRNEAGPACSPRASSSAARVWAARALLT